LRVLITGGAGFIGSNLAIELAETGHEIGIIDDLSAGKRENVHPSAWARIADILDPAFPSLVAEFAPDAVVHLAAQASVAASLLDPDRDWAVNAEGSRIVALAARACGAKRLISASSAAVYGEPAPGDLPLSEAAAKSPANPYGRSKLAAESFIAEALAESDTDWASFRFSNVYGPRQDGEGEGGVVAVFCQRLHDSLTPVVYGDGSQTRDFIFVGDVVGAIAAALASDATLAPGSGDDAAYNVSTGRETSVNDLFAALAEASHFSGGPEHAPARECDVMRSSLDPRKAEGAFGWRAKQPLLVGAELTWRWYAAQA
jgi:UDP-glucose 4-epimerase